MTYATKADMIERHSSTELVQLTDREGTGDIDDTVLDRALNDADAEINGYLIGRYALPLASVPAVLQRLACEIARYHLYDQSVPEAIAQRYKDAIRALEAIAKGTISLGLDALGASVAPSGAPEFSAPERIFTRETLEGY
jgi:phage gp36-like protein